MTKKIVIDLKRGYIAFEDPSKSSMPPVQFPEGVGVNCNIRAARGDRRARLKISYDPDYGRIPAEQQDLGLMKELHEGLKRLLEASLTDDFSDINLGFGAGVGEPMGRVDIIYGRKEYEVIIKDTD